jgi:AcrR family transcriptional regulator
MNLPVIDMERLKAGPKRAVGRPLSFDRDAALHQAMLMFWRHGYETTSVADLTAAMGITAPSLYTAFGDKKRLFLEAMRLYAGNPDEMRRSIAEARSARAAARAMLLAAAAGFTGAATPKGCLLASATASGSPVSCDVQRAVTRVRRRIENLLRHRIARDVAERRLPSDTAVGALAAMIIAVIQGMSVLARDGAGRARLIAVADQALRAWPPETARS